MPAPKPYWSLRDMVIAAQAKRITDEREAIAELQRLLSIAIKRQCLSDVPLGRLSVRRDRFLDDRRADAGASAVSRSAPSRSAFREGAFDEAEDARKVAAHLGTSHTELYVDPKTAMDVIPKLPRCTTSHSPIPRKFRRIWYRRSRDSMSPWRCRATPATSCSAATTAMCGVAV